MKNDIQTIKNIRSFTGDSRGYQARDFSNLPTSEPVNSLTMNFFETWKWKHGTDSRLKYACNAGSSYKWFETRGSNSNSYSIPLGTGLVTPCSPYMVYDNAFNTHQHNADVESSTIASFITKTSINQAYLIEINACFRLVSDSKIYPAKYTAFAVIEDGSFSYQIINTLGHNSIFISGDEYHYTVELAQGSMVDNSDMLQVNFNFIALPYLDYFCGISVIRTNYGGPIGD
jgi:hypothetical protein